MLTYRMIGKVRAPNAAMRIVEPSVFRWLEGKGYNVSDLGAAWTDVGSGARASRFAVGSQPHGDLRERYILREPHGYTSTITLDEIRADSCRLWIDVDSPEGGMPAATPRIVRGIIEAADVFDGGMRLTGEPELVDEEALERLYDAINDEQRTASVLVAGTPDGFPMDDWKQLVGRVTKTTVGLASTFVLNTAATETFIRDFGSTRMAARPGAIRTYLPGAYLEDDSDFARHKTLGAERLATDREKYLGRILEHATRNAVLAQPLPADVNRVDHVLAKAQFEDLVGAERSPETRTEAAPTTTHEPVVVTPPAEPEAPETSLPDSILHVIEMVKSAVSRWATWPFSEDVRSAIARRLAETPDELARRTAQATEQLQSVEIERDAALKARQSAESRQDDLDIELAETLERAQNLDYENRKLRVVLQKSGQGEAAWSVDSSQVPPSPTEYIESIDRGRDLPYLRFHIDEDDVADLQTASSSLSRPPQVLRAFEALSDYARACSEGAFSGGFRDYLDHGPDGFRMIPPKWLATGESQTVRQDPNMAAQRVFGVPRELEPAGSITVMTHLRFGKDTRDPRVYFHDDLERSGEIWILYVGRHKDVKGSN